MNSAYPYKSMHWSHAATSLKVHVLLTKFVGLVTGDVKVFISSGKKDCSYGLLCSSVLLLNREVAGKLYLIQSDLRCDRICGSDSHGKGGEIGGSVKV